WVQQGSPAGSILASVMFLIVGLLPDDAFFSWGWRVPFLLSAVLVIVGLVIRLKVEESKDFSDTKANQQIVKMPLVTAIRTAPTLVVFGVLASIMGIAMAYFNNTFLLSWATGPLGIERQLMLNIILGIAILQFGWQPIAAKIAERFGLERVMLAGLGLMLVSVLPLFLSISVADPFWIAASL